MWNKIIIRLLIALIALLLAVAGFLFYFTGGVSSVSQIVPQIASTTEPAPNGPIVTASNVSTADWKTYTNAALGFSLEYPQNMVAEEEPTNASSAVFLNIYVPEASNSINPDNAFPSLMMTISADPKTCGDKTSTIEGVTDESVTLHQEQVGAHQFLSGDLSAPASPNNSSTEIYLQQSVPCEGIEVYPAKTPSTYFTQQGYTQFELIQAIIASMKTLHLSVSTAPVSQVQSVQSPGPVSLTTTGSTTGWHTYSNYGISFNYPSTWEQPQFSNLGGYGLAWKQVFFQKEQVFITWDQTLNGQQQTITDSMGQLVTNGSSVDPDSNNQGTQITIDGHAYPTLLSISSFSGVTTTAVSVYIPDANSESGYANVGYTTCVPSDCKESNGVSVAHSDIDTNTIDLLIKSFRFSD